MESVSVTQQRREWEQAYEAATPDERERLIVEWAESQRRKRMTVKERAEEVVAEMFGDAR